MLVSDSARNNTPLRSKSATFLNNATWYTLSCLVSACKFYTENIQCNPRQYWKNITYFFLQAFIVPLQGFLNAIVYGWTREEFIHIMAIGIGHHNGWHVEETVERESESQPLHSSLSKHDTSVTDKTTDE